MKKILVPIDYSASADNAVCYAIHIANTIKASIHLVHGIIVPELSPMAGLVVWPLEDYATIKTEADEKLANYVTALKKNIDLDFSFLPEITFSTEIGNVNQVVNQKVSENKIDLIVMGMSGASDLKKIIFGSNSLALINTTKTPLLLIPKNAKFNFIKKIAFGTDLHENDLDAIQSIARLFCLFNPEILLSHVSANKSDFHNPSSEANKFLRLVTCKINYRKIYYRHIQDTNIDNGLTWLTKNAQVDLLTMVHRKANFFSKLFDFSHSQNIAKHIQLPLLVLQEKE